MVLAGPIEPRPTIGPVSKLDPAAILVWRWSIAFWGSLVAVSAGSASWFLLRHYGLLVPGSVATAAVLVTALSAWRIPKAMWSHWSYELSEEALVLEHGVWFQENSVVPWSRVQHVDISHGPLDRRFGLAQLKIHTASAKSDAKLPGLEAARAESLRLEILDRYRRSSTPA